MEEKNRKKISIDLSNKHFQKIVTVCLLIGIITVFGFIVYYVLTPEEGFINFGVLDQNQKVENIPENATVGEDIYFFLNLENYMKRDFSFYIKILTGDNTTVLSKDPGIGNLNQTLPTVTLADGESWMSANLSMSFWNTNNNPKRIIFEVWEDLDTDSLFSKYWLYITVTN